MEVTTKLKLPPITLTLATAQSPSSRKKVYFPGLNGLRFLAALSVVIVHIEQFKSLFQVSEPLFLPKFLLSGNDAVTLFFVLSGFLITYLLFIEHKRTGQIDVRSFYMRRILRIWPLYYLLVFIGFVAIPLITHSIRFQGVSDAFSTNSELFLYLIFLPNAVGFFATANLTLSHLWTIGIEEQFYLIWPPLLRQFIRYPLVILIGIIVFKILVHRFDSLIVVDNNYPQWFRYFISFLANFRIESMAVGGIGAYVWFHKPQRILNIIFHPIIEKVILGLMIGNVLVFPGDGTVYPDSLILSFLYILFILNLACNPKSTLNLENRYLRQLGNYSYGIYMYHLAVIYLCFIGLSYTRLWEMGYLVYNFVLYTLVISATIGISALSYHQFEMRFLAFKDRFQIVETASS